MEQAGQEPAILDLNAADQAFKGDPYPVYAESRRSAPVRRITLNSMPAWLVTRYEDVRQALTDPRLSNTVDNLSPAIAATGPWVLAERAMGLDQNVLRRDPPQHTRLRQLVTKAFTPGRIEALRPRVQEMADELLATFVPLGEGDLIADFAFPFPLMVIMELLGMPFADRDQFRRWATMTVPRPDGSQEELLAGYGAIRAYFADLVAAKTRQPGGDDLLSALVAVRDEGERLNEDELLGMAWLLLTAGHSTTVDLIGSGMLTLLREPERHAALRADPGLLPGAIEEMLRYDSPIELGISRFTTADVTIGDVTIPGGGEIVFLAVGSANRDEERFPDADRFDLRRTERGHIAFGHGLHYCIGAALARMEALIAFRALLDRCPDLTLAIDPADVVWQVNPHLRGPAALPVRWTAP